MIKKEIEKKRQEFNKDIKHRRSWHRIMNYHYLMYRGISLLNQKYSREVLESLGLRIHIPRTFMTIESIRPDLDRPLDITVRGANKKERLQAEKAQHTLKGEWQRSKADKEKAKAEFDSLLFGSGYLLSYFESNEEETEVLTGYDDEGRPKYNTEKQTTYEGMKIKRLDPYYVIPDRKAKTYEPGEHNSPRRIWVVAIWDYDEWLKECKKQGYNTEGMVKGGQTEELDRVKNIIDSIYIKSIKNLGTRQDNGSFVSEQPDTQSQAMDEDNQIGVIYEYTKDTLSIYSGENWTENYTGKYQFPKKEIPIYALKDVEVPGVLEGIGEAEAIRWQQYEENKIHNLMYLQVILNTVKRYGVVEQLLEDPTQLRASRMTEPLRLKYLPGIKASDAVSMYDQSSASDVPLNVLNEVKAIGQMTTGQTDYAIGANKGDAGTLGEAEMMNIAGNKRIKQKIQQMEERGITPILESWLSAIPYLYTEEMDYLINDGTNKDVKFLPFHRSYNENSKLVAQYSVKEGVMDATTLEDVYKKAGYTDVVFVSDLVGKYDITPKTSLAFLDRQNMIRQYQAAINEARAANQEAIAMGQSPVWDTTKLTQELLSQFSDIIENVEEYKLEQSEISNQPINQPIQNNNVPIKQNVPPAPLVNPQSTGQELPA